MSTDAIATPLPRASKSSETGRMQRLVESQPSHTINKVTEQVNELNQPPASLAHNSDEVQQIKSIKQSIARYMHSLSYHFTESMGHDGQVQTDFQKATPLQSKQTQESHGHWYELADFFVSFGFTVNQDGQRSLQTRVHHSQVDASEQWPGIAIGPLLNWILSQLIRSLSTESEIEPVARVETGSPATKPASQIVARPALRLPSSPPEPGIVKANNVENQLSLSIPPAGDLSPQRRLTSIASPTNHPASPPKVDFLLILCALARLLPPPSKT